MKYLSIDIETTGLDPVDCQVLEFAAVLADTEDVETPVTGLRYFHTRVMPRAGRIHGELVAIGMHAKLFQDLIRGPSIRDCDLLDMFVDWAGAQGLSQAYTVAGKNFQGFDVKFLEMLPGYYGGMFKHRVMDPAMLFMRATDTSVPSLLVCKQRAGIDTPVAHTALEDARDVVRLIRVGLGGGK